MRILKLGGSLTRLKTLGTQLDDWVHRFPHPRTMVVTGGGPWADAVRELDRTRGLNPRAAHRLAIRAMSLVAWTLAQELPTWRWTNRWLDVHRWLGESHSGAGLIFDPAEFLAHEEPGLWGTALPCGWHVTSDSIAARIAECLAAEQLVLLKSRAAESSSVYELSRAGFVDPFFRSAARRIPHVSVVDFPRGTAPQPLVWRDSQPTKKHRPAAG